jgi:mono/diheme cytochrome c family protein
VRACAGKTAGDGAVVRFPRFLGRCLGFLVLAATISAADRVAPPWEKPAAFGPLGQTLFREHCTVCHDIDKDQKSTRKIGPSLHHLFKNPRLPLSKARPNRDYVTVRIRYGGPLMPSFMTKIKDAQLAALLAYLESK